MAVSDVFGEVKMDIKTVFTQYCGPSVLFASQNHEGRTLTVVYTIPALDPDQAYTVVTHLRNGMESLIWHAARRCAYEARNDAFRRTGQRDALIKESLAGRLVG